MLDAFSEHDLLAAYIRSAINNDDRSERVDVDSACDALLYQIDELAARKITDYLSNLTDDDFENELER